MAVVVVVVVVVVVKLPAADTSHRRLVTFGGWKEGRMGRWDGSWVTAVNQTGYGCAALQGVSASSA